MELWIVVVCIESEDEADEEEDKEEKNKGVMNRVKGNASRP
jgi:hypothetical protein